MTDYTGENNIETVHANLLDETRIYYRCNWCRKNHSHGNMEELGNYIHYRGCHCRHAGAPSDVKIIVDDATIRTFKKKQSNK